MNRKKGRYARIAEDGSETERKWLSDHKEAERAHVLATLMDQAADSLADKKLPAAVRADIRMRVERMWRAWYTELPFDSAKTREIVRALDLAHGMKNGHLDDLFALDALRRTDRERRAAEQAAKRGAVRLSLGLVDPSAAARVQDSTIDEALAVWRRGRGRPKGSKSDNAAGVAVSRESQWDAAARLASEFTGSEVDAESFRVLVTTEGYYSAKV